MLPRRLGELTIQVSPEAGVTYAEWRRGVPVVQATKELETLLVDATLREGGYYRLRSRALSHAHSREGLSGVDLSAWVRLEGGIAVVYRITVRGRTAHRGAGRTERRGNR